VIAKADEKSALDVMFRILRVRISGNIFATYTRKKQGAVYKLLNIFESY